MSNDPNRSLQLIIAISRGIIQNDQIRRRVLGGAIAGAVVLLLLGAFPFAGWLGKHIVIFLLYWGACAWLTMLAILMSLFDMLIIRQQAEKERRAMARTTLKKKR